MNLQERIDLLIRVGDYISSGDERWQQAKQAAAQANNWFTTEFIEKAAATIGQQFLQRDKLMAFIAPYDIPVINPHPRIIGLVMAGNIPLVGFHDWMCTFLTGNIALIKASSKDVILLTDIIERMYEWAPESRGLMSFSGLLKGCDAYIATGSNNSARYFDYYFGKYPNIIRRNRTSVAVLTGDETEAELALLADDIQLYFGMGCRNVSKLYVPEEYDFIPLIKALGKYKHFEDHHKYKNNYDYQLAIHLLNGKPYMSSGSVLLSEDSSLFSPISQVNYEHYRNLTDIEHDLAGREDIQCIVGSRHVPFGSAQCPALDDFADGVDTIRFLQSLQQDGVGSATESVKLT